MKTNEEFEALNTLVVSLGMIEKIAEWLQSRKTSSPTKPTEGSKGIFLIVYKVGIPCARYCTSEKVGYGARGWLTYGHVNNFVEQCKLNDKSGKLPSKDILSQCFSNGLSEKIKTMDGFLQNHGIDTGST